LIAEIDSAKLQESGVETLALGESIVPQDQVKILPIYSGEKLGVQFTVYARIDYHVDLSGIDIKGTQSYLRANRTPCPIWEETLFRIELLTQEDDGIHIPNSRTYQLTLKGYLNYDEMYPEGGGHESYVNIEHQIVQL
jgi:hypothetical protein